MGVYKIWPRTKSGFGVPSADCAKGAGGKGPRQKRQKSPKSVKKFSDTFGQFSRRSKIVKKRQKVFRHFSTIFARHHFSGPFWGALIPKASNPTSYPLLDPSHDIPKDPFVPKTLCIVNLLLHSDLLFYSNSLSKGVGGNDSNSLQTSIVIYYRLHSVSGVPSWTKHKPCPLLTPGQAAKLLCNILFCWSHS